MTITFPATPGTTDAETTQLVVELSQRLDLTVRAAQDLVSRLDELAARARVLESRQSPFGAADTAQWGATARRCLTDLRDARVAASHVDAPLATLAHHLVRLCGLTTQHTEDPNPLSIPSPLRLARVVMS